MISNCRFNDVCNVRSNVTFCVISPGRLVSPRVDRTEM